MKSRDVAKRVTPDVVGVHNQPVQLIRVLEWLEKGSLCLVLGAGASADIKVPLWTDLVRGMGRKQGLPEESLRRWTDLAFLFELLIPDLKEQREYLRAALYPAALDPWVLDFRYRNVALWDLAWLSVLIAASDPLRSWHVVTYNFDVHLEKAILALGYPTATIVPAHSQWKSVTVSPDTRKITRRILPRLRRPVRVLHAHGVLFHGDIQGDPQWESPLMASGDYARAVGSYAEVSNRAQLASFYGQHCLFYGWSFTDYAFRTNLIFGTDTRTVLPDAVRNPIHLALITSPGDPSPAEEFLDRRFEDWLLVQGVGRMGRYSYDQHRRFIRRVTQVARQRMKRRVTPRTAP